MTAWWLGATFVLLLCKGALVWRPRKHQGRDGAERIAYQAYAAIYALVILSVGAFLLKSVLGTL